jgi:hypothetical protein
VSDGEYDSEHDSDVDMRMENDVNAPDRVDIDSDVNNQRDGDDGEKKGEEKEAADEEYEVKEQGEDQDEEEDKDEDDGKDTQTIGQGEMVYTSADNVDNMVDDQAMVLPEQCQKIRKDTAWPQLRAPGLCPHTGEPCPRPQSPATHHLGGPDHLGLGTPNIPCLAV